MKTLPPQWAATKLADHLREPIRNGYSPRCPENPTGTWILSLSAVTHSGFDKTGIKPAPLGDERVAKNLLSAGDIVVSRSNTPDRVGLAGIYEGNPTPCSYPDLLMRVRLTENLDPKFLLAHLLSDVGRCFFTENARGSSGSMVKIDRSILESFSIPTPPIEEQRAIAYALSDMDALLAKLDQLIAKKRNIKQAAMQELLTGRRRLTGFSGEWNNTPISRIARIISGATPSTTIPSFWNGGINWCTPTDITKQSGKYLTTTERKISLLGLESCSAELLPPGALLLCTRATIGEIKIAAEQICTNQGFKSLVCHPEFHNQFIYYALQTKKAEMIERASGSTFLEISKHDLSAIKILTPQLAEQCAIATVLSDMDTEITALEARREKTRLIKQGMMQELLSGRVRLI
jgi:type I restriction enzyme, S subunit